LLAVTALAAPLLVALAVMTAEAQFGDMPGSGPIDPSAVPGSPFGAPQQAPPPECQELLKMRDETNRLAKALQAAGTKKAAPEELCKLFKVYLATQSKMLENLEERSAACRIPADVIKQVSAAHARGSQTERRICEVAMLGPQPARFGPRREAPGSSGDFWREDELQRLFGQ
jgi:hypothetical protein